MLRPLNRAVAPVALAALLVLGLAGRAWAGDLEDGKKALAARKYAEAAERFAKVVEADKDATNRDAILGLAAAASKGLLANHLDLAETAVTQWVKKNAGDAEARVALGRVFLALAAVRDDAKAKEYTFKDAIHEFEMVLEASPGHPDATVGLAEAHYSMGEFDQALETLDKLLSTKPTAAAHFWRGKTFYYQAEAAYRDDPKAERTLALFRKAKGASEASVKLDSTNFDAWMQLAYAAQYLGERDDAMAAYVKAAGLDAENPYPLKGIQALKTGDDAGTVAALEQLAKQVPSNVVVQFYLGMAHYRANRWDDALKAFRAYAERATSPGRALVLIGRCFAKQGKEPEAISWFDKALAKNPQDAEAAAELDVRLRAKHAEAAQGNLAAARACEEDYAALAKRAPENADVLNNGAFILREAYGRHKGESAWLPILKAATRMYEAAAKLVEDKPDDVLEGAPWAQRYGWAGTVSDTGLMFQFYPETFDAAKAEGYYLRALKLTNTGYFDAWNNLHKLYLAQKEYQKAYDLALKASEGLAQEDGSPHTTGRAAAAAEAKRLVDEGKAKAD